MYQHRKMLPPIEHHGYDGGSAAAGPAVPRAIAAPNTANVKIAWTWGLIDMTRCSFSGLAPTCCGRPTVIWEAYRLSAAKISLKAPFCDADHVSVGVTTFFVTTVTTNSEPGSSYLNCRGCAYSITRSACSEKFRVRE